MYSPIVTFDLKLFYSFARYKIIGMFDDVYMYIFFLYFSRTYLRHSSMLNGDGRC